MKAEEILDHATDIAAVTAIAAIATLHGSPSQATLAALSSIAIGKRVVKQ